MNGTRCTVFCSLSFVLFFGSVFSERNPIPFSFPSQYKIDTWGIEDGLPQNSVINNILKHSDATEVTFSLTNEADSLSIVIMTKSQ